MMTTCDLGFSLRTFMLRAVSCALALIVSVKNHCILLTQWLRITLDLTIYKSVNL